jgi:hypothetical protein
MKAVGLVPSKCRLFPIRLSKDTNDLGISYDFRKLSMVSHVHLTQHTQHTQLSKPAYDLESCQMHMIHMIMHPNIPTHLRPIAFLPHPTSIRQSTRTSWWPKQAQWKRCRAKSPEATPAMLWAKTQRGNLWMVAKSCARKRMVETCWNPKNSGINHLSTGAGFRNHPQYVVVKSRRTLL